ncbi:MAG: MBOAT family O-acyltransferase, partial [Leptospiraceae bacterium]|nr:MBOAT family O-acyltransferase [Leptospiraceae bacterium]
ILATIFINYLFHIQLNKTRSKLWVTLAIIANVINLGFFKYFYFFTKMFYQISGNEYFQEIGTTVKILLPFAISFYTFQLIAFHVDTYRRTQETRIELHRFTLFVLFFPVLIAGPIMRANEFFPNLEGLTPDKEKMIRGSYLFISGLIKKVLLADFLAPIVNPVYNNPEVYTGLSLFFVNFVYFMQLYLDFSGLTDMARGAGLLLGIEIADNFRAPFFAQSLSDFWTRWHITLSTWLRDYLFIPMGGSRVGKLRTYFNQITTMTIGGFWHGSDYTFILWGFYWGVMMAVENVFRREFNFQFEFNNLLIKTFRAMIVFSVCSISLIMFRANSVNGMNQMINGIVGNNLLSFQTELKEKEGVWIIETMELVQSEKPFLLEELKNFESIVYIAVMVIVFSYFQNFPERLEWGKKIYILVLIGVLTVILLTSLAQGGDSFIYNQF